MISSPHDSGQAVVETALVTPVLVLLAILVLTGAEWLYTEIALTNAARAGAVAAAAAASRGVPALPAAEQAAQADGVPASCSAAGVPASCVSVTTQTGPESGVSLEVVDVYQTLTPWWRFSSAITLHAQAAAAS